MMKIKKNDFILVVSGKDKGGKGKVKESFPRLNRVKVEGVALVKKAIRPRREGEKGQMVQVPRKIDVSNVQLICPHCHQPTRIGLIQKGERKLRVCKKCQQVID